MSPEHFKSDFQNEAVMMMTENEKSAKKLAMTCYTLYVFSFMQFIIFPLFIFSRAPIMYLTAFFPGIAPIVAIVISYAKKDAVAGTFLESHFRWQRRTFWFGLLWCASTIFAIFKSGNLTLIFIGMLGFVVTGIWLVYRIIKGVWRLDDNRAMYV